MDKIGINRKRGGTLDILYQDELIAVISKPAGLAVQGGEGVGICVTDILSEQLGTRIFPVHRLDKDTAGVLVTALSKHAAALYSDFFIRRKIVKRYKAVCLNCPSWRSGEIRMPLERKNRDRCGPSSVQEAVTFYDVEKSSPDGSFCLVSLRIETGRMHQIRRHLASAGFPVAADDKYGDFKLNKEIRRLYGIRKLQLAAVSVTLPVMDGGKERQAEISCPLPPHMEECVAALFP